MNLMFDLHLRRLNNEAVVSEYLKYIYAKLSEDMNSLFSKQTLYLRLYVWSVRLSVFTQKTSQLTDSSTFNRKLTKLEVI